KPRAIFPLLTTHTSSTQRSIMTLYSFLLFVHVIAAVGGLGQLSVLGVMTRTSTTVDLALAKRILDAATGSLVVMLLSGIGLTWMVHWSFAQMWWFRLSMILFLLLGALLG